VKLVNATIAIVKSATVIATKKRRYKEYLYND
jgi:hypothetical protein